MTRRVYVEFPWGSHGYYRTLAEHPPEGYEFIVPDNPGWISRGRKLSALRSLHKDIGGRFVPLNLVKSYIDRRHGPPAGTDLTLAVNHVVLRDEPWIIEAEHAAFIISYRVERLNSARYRRWVERALCSSQCKRIVSWTRSAQRTMERNLDCTGFEHKFAVVPLAVPLPPVAAQHAEGRVRVLFVGTTNLPGVFYDKGGADLLEVMRCLRERFPDVGLVVRSDLPERERGMFRAIGAEVIDRELSEDEMDALFRSASLFLFPGHHTPWTAILEAMAYGLPVVAVDVHGTSELVTNGVTGFLVPKSERIPYFWDQSIKEGDRFSSVGSYEVATKRSDPRVVSDLVECVSILIEDEQLRRRMGAAARAVVERGEHSIGYRNRVLKQVLDEATSPATRAGVTRRESADTIG